MRTTGFRVMRKAAVNVVLILWLTMSCAARQGAAQQLAARAGQQALAIATQTAEPKTVPTPGIPPTGFTGLDNYRASRIAMFTDDYGQLARYRAADAELLNAGPVKDRVVFFGDSITDGWRLNEYFPDGDYVNRGIGGQITAEMLARMKADVIDLQPAAMLILAGTNDLARGIPLVAIENNYQMIADLATANHIKVIFASVLPVSDHHMNVSPRYEMTKERPPVFIKALNEWLVRFCAQRGYTYLNYFDAMVDPSGQMQAELADDGLHPNARGYRIMAPLALEAINKTLRPAAVPKPAPAPTPVKPGKTSGTSK